MKLVACSHKEIFSDDVISHVYLHSILSHYSLFFLDVFLGAHLWIFCATMRFTRFLSIANIFADKDANVRARLAHLRAIAFVVAFTRNAIAMGKTTPNRERTVIDSNWLMA